MGVHKEEQVVVDLPHTYKHLFACKSVTDADEEDNTEYKWVKTDG